MQATKADSSPSDLKQAASHAPPKGAPPMPKMVTSRPALPSFCLGMGLDGMMACKLDYRYRATAKPGLPFRESNFHSNA